MINIFNSDMYWVYEIPNFDEIMNFVDEQTVIDNSKFNWGNLCKVDRIPLNRDDTAHLLKPSTDLFCQEFKTKFNFRLFDPWINLYERGYYQEVHDHVENHLACVFFLNEGENFSDFFFFNRHSNNLNPVWFEIFPQISDDHWYPKVSAGHVMFFPGNMLHGVSPHNSDITRKTLSVNLNFMPL